MLKTSRKIFFSVVLISLLGSSSRCDAIFATLVVIAMKVAPYLIWTAPPVIIGGYQIYHNSLSDQMKRGFKKIGEKLQIIEVKVNANGIAIEVVKTRVESNGEAISELTKQENLHHQTAVQERAVLQKNTQANGDAIELVRTNLNTLRTAQTQDHNENQLKLQTLEEKLACASQERASMTATLTDNSGQLSGLTETQKQFKLLLQQQSANSSTQLTRIEEKFDQLLRLSGRKPQLAHHSPLQRRPLLWPSPTYTFLQRRLSMAQVYAFKQYPEITINNN